MAHRELDCLAEGNGETRPVRVVRPEKLEALLADLPAVQAGFLRACGFAARAGEVLLLPAPEGGVSGAVLGLGAERGPWPFGALPGALPPGNWTLLPGPELPEGHGAVLGFCLGAYRQDPRRPLPGAAGPADGAAADAEVRDREADGGPGRGDGAGEGPDAAGRAGPPGAAGETTQDDAGEASGRPGGRRGAARLVAPEGAERALEAARATWLVRDLVNTAANRLGPAELAAVAVAVGAEHGARVSLSKGAALEAAYPTVAAVGRGSERAPVVATLRWEGPGAGAEAPLVSLCGKGVCFDSGGLDLKPAAGMLRMKKDMGGAAAMLGLASMVMAARLPVRLVLRLGCVENAVSGRAMRPLDVLRTRRGLLVEVGNTDAEGRLVLCDLLAEASDERPALLLDAATLTGAARTALGPDLPALFCNDDALAQSLLAGGEEAHDPLWRLPLWDGYDSWLATPAADLNNVATRPMAGAVVAALFLRRFVAPGVPWAHLDLYAWNDATRPGRPEGGEAQGMRAAFGAILRMVNVADTNRTTSAT